MYAFGWFLHWRHIALGSVQYTHSTCLAQEAKYIEWWPRLGMVEYIPCYSGPAAHWVSLLASRLASRKMLPQQNIKIWTESALILCNLLVSNVQNLPRATALSNHFTVQYLCFYLLNWTTWWTVCQQGWEQWGWQGVRVCVCVQLHVTGPMRVTMHQFFIFFP